MDGFVDYYGLIYVEDFFRVDNVYFVVVGVMVVGDEVVVHFDEVKVGRPCVRSWLDWIGR